MLISDPKSPRAPRRRIRTPNLEIQPRDVAIIQHVAEHRFLRSSHIKQLVGFPSDRSCQERLKELRESRYLHLITPRFGDYREGGGRNPHIHALGNKGAELLAKRYGVWMSSRYAENNNAAGDLFIDHDLDLADFMVTLEMQCRERGNVELIPFYEILQGAPEATKQSRRQDQWKVAMEWGKGRHVSNVTPDKIFGLRDRARPQGKNRAFFFLEIDRGTETVEPVTRSLRKATILKKMVEYAHTHNEGLHRKHYNIPGFRVLFVTTKESRVQRFIETHRRVTRPRPLATPSSLFLFTHTAELRRHAHDIMTLPWLDGRGEPTPLIADQTHGIGSE